jgi:hypothetical protein
MSNVEVNCLAFSPDSQMLASAHRDGTILIWNAARDSSAASQLPDPPPLTTHLLTTHQQKWWADLAGGNSSQAYVAICALAAQPQQTVGLLRDRLLPATEVPQEKLRGLIADLDSRQFSERESAKKQLADLGEQAGPALRAALRNRLSPEQRRSVEQLLDTLYTIRSPEALRKLRAIEILERIGTSEAVEILQKLAHGASEARPTQEAKASLERLTMRADIKPIAKWTIRAFRVSAGKSARAIQVRCPMPQANVTS